MREKDHLVHAARIKIVFFLFNKIFDRIFFFYQLINIIASLAAAFSYQMTEEAPPHVVDLNNSDDKADRFYYYYVKAGRILELQHFQQNIYIFSITTLKRTK